MVERLAHFLTGWVEFEIRGNGPRHRVLGISQGGKQDSPSGEAGGLQAVPWAVQAVRSPSEIAQKRWLPVFSSQIVEA